MRLRKLAITIALPVTFVTGVTCIQGVANAQQPASPTAQDQAVAEDLFADAKKLMAEGKHAMACPKFEESQRLDPAPGTQFNLGECYEHVGRTASAWALFLNVAAAAKSANMADREKLARERAAALEPKLAKLTIVVPTPTPGLEIKRDGVVVGPAQYGSAFPIDPGSHPITASAPGKATWTSSVDVAAEGKASVSIPALADAVATPPPATAPPQEEQRGLGTQKTLALVAAGVGVVGLGVGTVFGLKDKSKLSDAESHCVGNSCDAAGVGLREDAVSAGNVSTVAFTVGLIAVAGAAVLWFTAPSSSTLQAPTAARPRVRVTPTLGTSTAGMMLKGSF